MRAIENPKHKIANTPISDSGWKPAMRNQSKIQNRKSKVARGFTLVELLVVMTIIGILLVFILNAAMGAVRQAQERATQSLITKLEAALNDRLDALLQTRPDYNSAHYNMGGIWNGPQFIPGIQRAQIIAWYDYIKAEIPDVFFVQNTTGPYPLNFAGAAYGASTTLANYILPIGNAVPLSSYGDLDPNTELPQSNPNLGFAGSGIFGASYTAAAGIYKNLGYLPQGYDGVDNSPPGTPGAGLIDEWDEGVNSTNQAQVQANLANHDHSTARSEMLYALLVEGRGPLGSVFNPDDFTDKEVQDTDHDGLPEFVDAWGKPLQFFRWPLLYHSDLQRGQVIINSGNVTQYNNAGFNYSPGDLAPPYLSPFEEREQDPLDRNQQLVAPGWWAIAGAGGQVAANGNSPFFNLFSPSPQVPSGVSGGVRAFEYFFHRLTEPYPHTGVSSNYWDRGGTYPSRRAFYSKLLIVSSGLDQQPGVFLYSDLKIKSMSAADAAVGLIVNENNAMPFGLDLFPPVPPPKPGGFVDNPTIPTTTIGTTSSVDPTTPTSYDIQQAAQDDISNQNLQAGGSIGGSGS
jgi:prepilin-type N-terminal cleavage/methylation domain-containing protein